MDLQEIGKEKICWMKFEFQEKELEHKFWTKSINNKRLNKNLKMFGKMILIHDLNMSTFFTYFYI